MLRRLLPILLPLAPLLSAQAAEPTPAELLKARTAKLVAAAELDDDEAFSEALLSNEAWQSELLDSGPVEKADEVVALLFGLWQADPAFVDRPIDRSMATACALESPRRGRDLDETIARYEFFRDRSKEGYLNSAYQYLSTFERRYLANGVQHGGFNSVESMGYQNREVCLPAERYTGACWYARYDLKNHFGDSIHGPLYYAPFSKSWPSKAEIVRNVGGVCGSLSNFGASAAIANGVPAMSMGEPGHCAYAVRTKPGHWQPAYSLSWKRSPHNAYFAPTWGWHINNIKAYEDPSNARSSGDVRRLAEHQHAEGNAAGAMATIREAYQSYPNDWQNWTTAVRILAESEAPQKSWQVLHQDAIQLVAPISGEVAFRLLKDHIYPKVLPAGDGETEAKRRGAILLTFQRALEDWGLARWDYDRALKHQLSLLGGDAELQDQFVVQAFGIHAKANVFTSNLLSVLLARSGDDEKRRQRNIAAIGKAITGGEGDEFKDIINTLARTILPDAARRGDRATFQYIGKLAAQNYAPNDSQPEPFPGILLSSGGIFSIPQPGNRWDNPVTHWGVIEEHGGDFHTAQKPAVATIQLGNFGRLSGVVIVQRGNRFDRLNGAKLQTSTDGKEWSDVHTFSGVRQNIQRIDLADKGVDAGYVRVFKEGGGDNHQHFRKFHVYGKKQN